MDYNMHNMNYKIENYSPSLPSGWKRFETRFANGLSTGKCQVRFTSPDGEVFYNKSQLMKKLGANFDYAAFNFQSDAQVNLKFQPRRYKDSQSASKPAIACRPLAVEMLLKRKRCSIVKNFPKNQSRKVQGANSIKSAPLQILQGKRFEPYVKNRQFKNFLTNSELTDVLQKQKSDFAREEVMGLLSQQVYHAQSKHTGPIPVDNVVSVTNNLNNTKTRSTLSLVDITDIALKAQNEKIMKMRSKLAEAI